VISALRIIFEQMMNPYTREAAWQRLGAHKDAAIGPLPAAFQSSYAGVGNGFCSAAKGQSFDSVLGARLRTLNGGELEVDRARCFAPAKARDATSGFLTIDGFPGCSLAAEPTG
jgi:hypothetical protein